MKKTIKIRVARVIRDSRDSTRDYFLPEWRAQQLFLEGKLVLISAYRDKWDYATPIEGGTIR